MSVHDGDGNLMTTEDAIKAIKADIARTEELMAKCPAFDNPFNRGIIEGHKLLLEKLEKEGNG